MPDLSRAERREIFFSLAGLISQAVDAFEAATCPDEHADPASCAEAAAQFALLDAEIERRLDTLGIRALIDRGGH